MVGGGGDNAIFKEIAGSEAQDAHGFDADVVIGRKVRYSRIGVVGDGAGQHVRGAAGCVGDANERNFDGLKAAIEIEIEVSELPGPEFVVDADASMNLLAGVAVAFEADFAFEEFDLGGVFFSGSGSGSVRLGLLSLAVRPGSQRQSGDAQKNAGSWAKARHHMAESEQWILKESLGAVFRLRKDWIGSVFPLMKSRQFLRGRKSPLFSAQRIGRCTRRRQQP